MVRNVKAYFCADHVGTLAHLLSKKLKSKSHARSILTVILDVFTTIPATESMLRDALDSEI